MSLFQSTRQGVESSHNLTRQIKEAGSSSFQEEVYELDEQPLVRNRPRRRSSASAMASREVGESEASPALNPLQPTVASQSQTNGNAFPDEVVISLRSIIMWELVEKFRDICDTYILMKTLTNNLKKNDS